MAERILVVDDDASILALVADVLAENGMEAVTARSGEEAVRLVAEGEFDLILLDIMMGGISGLEVCRRIRGAVACPILFLSAKDNVKDIVAGLGLGADDYLTKPFALEELVARIQAHLRRQSRSVGPKKAGAPIQIGDIRLDPAELSVRKGGEAVALSTREYELLAYLMQNAGQTLSRDRIFHDVWQTDFGDVGTVAINIKNLRTKLDPDWSYIKTVWGSGYRFVTQSGFDEARREGARDEGGGERRRFPGVGWLSSRLTRKVIAGLVVMAILSWLVMCWCFLLYLGAYAGHAYDAVLSDAESAAQRTAAFLEGCGGDYAQFQTYLIERGMGCTVRDSGGGLLFEYQPYGGEEGDISASGGAPARLPGGQELEVRVWVRAMGRQDISRTVGRGGLVGMLVLNICVFVVVALMLYFLVVAPIIRLRRTMQRYYESGERPERTQRMDEVGRLQNTFADLAGVLESKERAEHHLIASISHDIKTPLTSVMGYSERLLAAGLPPEKQRQYLQNVHEKALAIKSIVDEFDEYIDVGLRDTAPMRLITAGELCQRLRVEYQDELLDADVRLTVECACPGDQIICNWEHMRRFFGNLIGNAIQHAEASRLELRLQCRREEGQVVFLFSDNGRGVQEDLLQQIFEPLYTSDRGRKVSGLGLSICKSIITAHGGTIGARNRAEGGLEIRAALPRVDI